jgi:dienelactone hydrolase
MGQTIVLRLWSIFGVSPNYLALDWSSSESFDAKLKHLLGEIDKLSAAGHNVSLVGVSAGATAVLNAYAKRPDLACVVCICGKINNPQSVGRRIYDNSPAFMQSIDLVQSNVAKLTAQQRKSILCLYPSKDSYVPPADSIVAGSIKKRVITHGHILSIFYCLTFKSRFICSFIKSS